MHQRGAGAESVLDGGHEGQRLVLDVDQSQRVFGQLLALGCYGRDLIAGEADGRLEESPLLIPVDRRARWPS